MRCVFSATALLLCTLSTWAAEEAKLNKLTPKEVAEGWILLFEGETPFGWQFEGGASVDKGMLILGAAKDTTATLTTQLGYGDASFEALTDEAKDAKLTFNAFKQLLLSEVVLPRKKGWHSFNASAEPEAVSLGAAGTKGVGRGISKGIFGGTFDQLTTIAFHVPAGQKLLLRNIKFKPGRLTSIFNGKDLSGWKEFPGRKSKFTVTPEGWLNIKDGPGDLQTEGQWGDFVLQLDCISNGKHLNSGVFFRCRPGEYQQGYETQIRNQFTPEPTQGYTLELYDPKTGQLTDKQKAKYTAVDYGTGAIYRRQPARREVAKDGEWFTMTLVAHGRHMAVWVNGIQVTDWTDNRPFRANAREGCRLEKGPISLQGHDPTTDLSFRNFRIAELPAAKKD